MDTCDLALFHSTLGYVGACVCACVSRCMGVGVHVHVQGSNRFKLFLY